MRDATRGASRSDTAIQSIFDYAARIAKESDFDELIRLNADFARDLVGADRCSLWLVDVASKEIWTKVAHGMDPIRIPLGTGIVGTCISEDREILINDAENNPLLLRTIDQNSGYRTQQVLSLPLRSEGRVIGALQLLNKASGFTEKDLELMRLLGHFAANAIETERFRRDSEGAKLIKHELDLARDVQARLLPEPPTGVRGLTCAGFCRPARVIGGDYYDLLQLVDGSFAFTVGDVSGKGIPAAVMMASIQMVLRSNLNKSGPIHLPSILADLNLTLYVSSTAERYSTLFCGIISPDRSTLSYVNAGHISPLLLRSNGHLERLLECSAPIGLLPDFTYEEAHVSLFPGDTLVVVSDGIIEARDKSGGFWDEKEVERIVQDSLGIAPRDLTSILCDAADAFASDTDQYDDMTVLSIRIE